MMTDIDAPSTSMSSHIVQLTPMMEQYLRMKDKVGDALLFFRMGDFFELFHDDAIVAAKALNIALTSRQKMHDEPIPMCGVPAHSAEGYIDRLVQQGFKVAICEQVEDPKQAKGLVKRDIIRVVTPGTVVSGSTLTPKEHNFLASIALTEDGAGFAYIDISTGTFAVTAWEDDNWQYALRREYERVQPREVLAPEHLSVRLDLFGDSLGTSGVSPQPWDSQHFCPDRAYRVLSEQFGVQTLESFGCEGHDLAIAAAGALLTYVHETQHAAMLHLNGLRFYSTDDFLVLDDMTRHNLELFRSHSSQGRVGSLLEVIDDTVTAMGGRLLRQWLSQPLSILPPLLERQEAVVELVEQPSTRTRLRQGLDTIADIERILSRLSLGSITPRDLAALRHSITTLPTFEALLQTCQSHLLATLAAQWDALDDLATLIADALVDDPPATWRDGRVIRPGYAPDLDTLREYGTSGKTWLTQFEAEERQRTGISSLRIGFNKVFGYYIEIRKTHVSQTPDDYQRKQTLVNAERFITPALKEREVYMLRAEEQALHLEHQLFEALRQQLTQHIKRIQHLASILSQLDVLAALAEVAATRQYCRPILDTGESLVITEGRHPVLEVSAQDERFVPNDTFLDRDTQQIMLLTGPNMAGKSTYMRQVALLVILAQTGSFIPAREAHIGLVDRIFTRVGAQDFLAKGQSTFMVEMTETANILHNMSSRSLILLDEIGRGTSTYDGMSIAWAVIEHLHEHCGLHPRTLFATHYHELTKLGTTLDRVKNYNAAVREWGDKIIFLRKILAGSADRSYGIQVARLAGLPNVVLERARQLLADLESAAHTPHRVAGSHGSSRRPQQQSQLSLFDDLTTQLMTDLRSVAMDDLSPREALNMLADLQHRAQGLP
ncbi:DNA mismatch repair protein MutS [Candidatus Entotheonellaceae bacterium PAL068K]